MTDVRLSEKNQRAYADIMATWERALMRLWNCQEVVNKAFREVCIEHNLEGWAIEYKMHPEVQFRDDLVTAQQALKTAVRQELARRRHLLETKVPERLF